MDEGQRQTHLTPHSQGAESESELIYCHCTTTIASGKHPVCAFTRERLIILEQNILYIHWFHWLPTNKTVNTTHKTLRYCIFTKDLE